MLLSDWLPSKGATFTTYISPTNSVSLLKFRLSLLSKTAVDVGGGGDFIFEAVSQGAFHSTKTSGNSGMGSEWNSHFPEFHSEILGVPCEVGLKFRKIGIPGKFRSIRPFLLGPSFSEPGNRIQHG